MATIEEIRRADTTWIITDSGEQTATVYSMTYNYDYRPPTRSSSSVVSTHTVQVIPTREFTYKSQRGLLEQTTHVMIFPYTSTVNVTDHIFLTGETDYYEIVGVRDYEDRKFVETTRVKGAP